MKKSADVRLTLSQTELNALHNALTDYRCKLSNLVAQLNEMGLPTNDAQALAHTLAGLSGRMCDLMTE